MSEREHRKDDLSSNADQVPELKKLAFMYHAWGHYAKSDEIMNVVYDIEAKRAARERKAA